jgi:hypothetical protein
LFWVINPFSLYFAALFGTVLTENSITETEKCPFFGENTFNKNMSRQQQKLIIQINQQDATVLQVYYLMFMCGSTCFGRLFAHHQEHTTALGASGFTVECGGWSVVGHRLAG